MSVAEVKIIASALEEGETVREVCPFCNGGSTTEKSLNVSVVDGCILWNCHRASCLQSGGASTTGASLVRTSERPKEKKSKILPYSGSLENLSQEWREYLEKKIGWTGWHLEQGRPMYAPEEHRVAFPIFSPMGVRRGWVLRSYDQFAKRKTLTRMDVGEPHLSFYRPNNTPHVVIVEDIPSAVRAARYIDAVALCGGGCGLSYAQEIADEYDAAIWALDADATQTAIQLQQRYRILFRQSKVLVLEEDMKDMTEERLMETLHE